MFDDMSSGKRMLVLTAILVIPLLMAMYLFFNVFGTLSARDQTILDMQQEQQGLQLRRAKAIRAINRGRVYRSESLPSDTRESLVAYYSWLSQLVEEKFGAGNYRINKGATIAVNAALNDKLYDRQSYTVIATGELKSIVDFVYSFDEVRLLQRISSLTLKPEVQGMGSSRRTTGRIDMTATVDVVALRDADAERDFANQRHEELERTLAEYHDTVTRRNLFGPPNESPEFDTDRSVTLLLGKPLDLEIKADDDGAPEELQYELVESSVADARLDLSDPESPRLEAGELAEGDYEFLLRVTDNGWPRLDDELSLTVSVEQPEAEPEPIVEPPPVFAKYAFISGFSTNADGQPVVWIRVPQPDDELHRLTVGESFTLDEATWTVQAIEGESVTIDVDGDIRDYVFRDSLYPSDENADRDDSGR